MMEEHDEEVTVFDRTSLLSSSKSSKPPTKSHKLIYTFALLGSIFGLGLALAIPGPTLKFLACNVSATITTISYIFPARSVGYLVGAIAGGLLFDRFASQDKLLMALGSVLASVGMYLVTIDLKSGMLASYKYILVCLWLVSYLDVALPDRVDSSYKLTMVLCCLMVAIGIIAAPWTSSLTLLCFLLSLASLAMGFLDTGGNVICLRLWGKSSGPYLQALHFSFGLGAFLAPVIVAPFLASGSTGLACNITGVTITDVDMTPELTSPISEIAHRMNKRQFNVTTQLPPLFTGSSMPGNSTATLPVTNGSTHGSASVPTSSPLVTELSRPSTTAKLSTMPMVVLKPVDTNVGKNVPGDARSASGNNIKDSVDSVKEKTKSGTMTNPPSSPLNSDNHYTTNVTTSHLTSVSSPSTDFKSITGVSSSGDVSDSSTLPSTTSGDEAEMSSQPSFNLTGHSETDLSTTTTNSNLSKTASSSTSASTSTSKTSATLTTATETQTATTETLATTAKTQTTTTTSLTPTTTTTTTTTPTTTTTTTPTTTTTTTTATQTATAKNLDDATTTKTAITVVELSPSVTASSSEMSDNSSTSSTSPPQSTISNSSTMATNPVNTTTSQDTTESTSNAINSLFTLIGSISKVQFSYLIVGLVLMLFTVIFCGLNNSCCSCNDKQRSLTRQNSLADVSDGRTEAKPSRTYVIRLMTFTFIFFLLYVGTEITYGQFVATFSMLHYKFTEQQAAWITSAYWGAFALSRGLAVPISKCMSPAKMLVSSIIITLTSVVGLAGSAYSSSDPRGLWLFSCTLGVGMAAIFPTGILWLEKYVAVTAKMASLFVVGSSLGEMIIPSLSGFLIDTRGELSLMIILLVSVTGCALAFGAMHCAAQSNRARYSAVSKDEAIAMRDFEFTSSDEETDSEPILSASTRSRSRIRN